MDGIGHMKRSVPKFDAKTNGVIRAVEKPRGHVHSNRALQGRVLACRRHTRDAVVKGNLSGLSQQGNVDPGAIAPFFILQFEVLMVDASGAKGRQSVSLAQSDIAIAIRKGYHQFTAATV